jgi:hypothetical protein
MVTTVIEPPQRGVTLARREPPHKPPQPPTRACFDLGTPRGRWLPRRMPHRGSGRITVGWRLAAKPLGQADVRVCPQRGGRLGGERGQAVEFQYALVLR